jgi:hypothetical protein
MSVHCELAARMGLQRHAGTTLGEFFTAPGTLSAGRLLRPPSHASPPHSCQLRSVDVTIPRLKEIMQ